MKKLLLTLLISISLIGTASALTFSNSSNNNNNSSKSAKSLDAFDGEYPFVLSRFKSSDDPKVLGSGVLVIENGTISVSSKNRILNTSSTKYYDTLKGRINKKGKIKVKFKVNALTGKGRPRKVSFSGNIKNLKIKGKFDDFKLTIDISTGDYRLTGERSLSTTSWGYSVVSDIVRAGKDSQRFEVRPGDCGEDPGKME